MTRMTVGEHLIELLEIQGVDTVFGIPGVHTIELYRGLASSKIQHVTPRHEQGAGFMADGYARVSGKPGVAFVITGPGLTNILTAMAQARQDSIPMLVISGVNARGTKGKGLGLLHELPDQQDLASKVALWSNTIENADELEPALVKAFAYFKTRRGGPIHIEIPTDVMKLPSAATKHLTAPIPLPALPAVAMRKAADLISGSRNPVILIGGGARNSAKLVAALAEKIDAPVVQTTNARGVMHKHRLIVPASPSLMSVRSLLAASDCVIAIGTEWGQTDFDMNNDNGFPALRHVIRVDIDAAQIKCQLCEIAVAGDAGTVLAALIAQVSERKPDGGAAQADACRIAAKAEIGPRMRSHLDVVKIIRDTLPGSVIVGDSTQAVYAGNLYYDHDRAGGWFNSATGFGTLGYAAGAVVGAALANKKGATVCISGDGGIQFSLAELGSAADINAPIIYVVWNNNGYQEIEASMLRVAIKPIGVTPQAPDFCGIAKAYGIASAKPHNLEEFATALKMARKSGKPFLIELDERIAEGKTV